MTEAQRTRSRVDLLGAGLILVTALQFGAIVVLGKVASRRGLPVPSLLAYRFGVAALILAAALVGLRQPLRAARGEAWRLAALGAFGYGVEAAFFFTALRHGTAAAATLLFFTYPALVALFAFLVGRGLPGWQLGGALIASVIGAATVAVSGGGVEISRGGVLLALAASGTFAMYLVGADAVLKRTNSLTGATWMSASSAIGLAAFAVMTGTAALPHGWRQWGPVLAMAAFTSGAFACLFAGLKRLGAVRTAILSATEPLAAAALAAVFLGEAVHVGTAVGGAFIVGGAMAASVARGRPGAEPPIP